MRKTTSHPAGAPASILVRSLVLGAWLALAGCSEGPGQLTFAKLVDRPELWPLEMTLTSGHEADYHGESETLPAGTTMVVSEVYADILVGRNAQRGHACIWLSR
jgi:hypothetical protein